MRVISLIVLGVFVSASAFAMTWDEVNELYKTDRQKRTIYIGE